MAFSCPKHALFLSIYTSPREIKVVNWKISAMYYSIILLVLLYVIFGTIIINKGYQISDEAVGTVSTKVKGTASTGEFNNLDNRVVYDAMDIIYPSIESNALFLTTSFVETASQHRGICDGNTDITDCNNTGNVDPDSCEEHDHHWASQGVLTGICGSNNRCQVQGWCPLEDDSNPTVLNNVGEFTVFVKNNIRFPNFDIETTNARKYAENEGETAGVLTWGMNLFRIDDIVAEATHDQYNTSMFAKSGAIIFVDIDWSCNLDHGLDACVPRFTFDRIDNDPDGVSTGFNFRTVLYQNNSNTRHLKKFYGIRLAFMSSGKAGKFDFVALTITFGAGVAYLGIAKLITDMGLTYLMRNDSKFQSAKSVYLSQMEKHRSVNQSVKDLFAIKKSLDEMEDNTTVQTGNNKSENGRSDLSKIENNGSVPSEKQNALKVMGKDIDEANRILSSTDCSIDISTDSDFDNDTTKALCTERAGSLYTNM